MRLHEPSVANARALLEDPWDTARRAYFADFPLRRRGTRWDRWDTASKLGFDCPPRHAAQGDNWRTLQPAPLLMSHLSHRVPRAVTNCATVAHQSSPSANRGMLT